MTIKALFATGALEQGWGMVSFIVRAGTSRGRRLAAESLPGTVQVACPCVNSKAWERNQHNLKCCGSGFSRG